jgi:cytoskeletal protein RodZ
MAALGERFRAAREARGLSLSDVSEQIRIRSVYLTAIEDENWTAIGAPVYIRGFLRTYARFLGLDPEEVVAAFNGSSPTASSRSGPVDTSSASSASRRESSAYAAAAESPRRRGSLLVWAAALVAVVLIAIVAYNEWTFRQQGAPAVAVASASPSPLPGTSAAASATPALAPVDTAAANTLALTLTAPSWLRVTVDGSVSMEGTFPAGTSKTFHGKSALVRIGNAGGVEIRVDGKDVGKLGHSGDVVERSFTL